MPHEPLPIGEFAHRAGVSVSALRFYEQRGLLRSTRTGGNQRRYAREELRRVAFVRAAREVGLTIEEIGAALDSLPAGRVPSRRDWQRLSARWRRRIDGQIAQLEALRDRLDGCIGCGCLSLTSCTLYNPHDELAAQGGGAHRLLAESERGRR